MEDVFVRIENYPDYRAGSLGNVLSLKKNKEKILKPIIGKDGYARVELCNENGKRKFFVHRLIAEAFIPNPHNLKQVNHIDENKLNNAIDNLEWCTAKYNINFGTGIKKRASKSKKKVGRFSLNGKLLQVYDGLADAERAGYTHSAISEVCSGKRQSHKGYIWKFV